MKHETKAKLVNAIQAWLDDESVADDLGGNLGILQDITVQYRNANLCVDAVEIAIRGQALQSTLSEELE